MKYIMLLLFTAIAGSSVGIDQIWDISHVIAPLGGNRFVAYKQNISNSEP